MAGGPIQQPRTQLPGAEYFALTPGGNIALGPRLQIFIPGTSTSIPASTTTTIVTGGLIVPQFAQTDGIYIARVYAIAGPGDASGELSIATARLGLGPASAGNIQVDIGYPLSTFTALNTAQVAILDRDALIVASDMSQQFTPSNSLFLSSFISVHNADTTNAHSVTIQMNIIFHSLKGFTA